MKKNYTKPDIVFESFSLCTDIAIGCEHSTNFARNVCGVEYTDTISVYTTNESGCSLKYEDGTYEGICYHNPTSHNNVFAS